MSTYAIFLHKIFFELINAKRTIDLEYTVKYLCVAKLKFGVLSAVTMHHVSEKDVRVVSFPTISHRHFTYACFLRPQYLLNISVFGIMVAFTEINFKWTSLSVISNPTIIRTFFIGLSNNIY